MLKWMRRTRIVDSQRCHYCGLDGAAYKDGRYVFCNEEHARLDFQLTAW